MLRGSLPKKFAHAPPGVKKVGVVGSKARSVAKGWPRFDVPSARWTKKNCEPCPDRAPFAVPNTFTYLFAAHQRRIEAACCSNDRSAVSKPHAVAMFKVHPWLVQGIDGCVDAAADDGNDRSSSV